MSRGVHSTAIGGFAAYGCGASHLSFSCKEMVIRCTSLSFPSMHCALCAYMQDSSLSQAEHWLCLSAQARRMINTILPRNPRWKPAPVKDLPMNLTCCPALRTAPSGLGGRENPPPERTRIDQKQAQRRKRLLLLPCELYSSLLQGDAPPADPRPAKRPPLGPRLLPEPYRPFWRATAQPSRRQEGVSRRSLPRGAEVYRPPIGGPLAAAGRGAPINLADASAALLKLPPSDPLRLSEALHLPLPPLEADMVWKCVDITKAGSKCRSLQAAHALRTKKDCQRQSFPDYRSKIGSSTHVT